MCQCDLDKIRHVLVHNAMITIIISSKQHHSQYVTNQNPACRYQDMINFYGTKLILFSPCFNIKTKRTISHPIPHKAKSQDKIATKLQQKACQYANQSDQ